MAEGESAPATARPARMRKRPRRRTCLISPDRFRDLRHSCLLGNRKAAAAYLGVCVRTIRHWDAGRCRVPWSVVRLLRLLRAGELGGLLEGWDGWTIYRDRLVSPDGRDYRERDMRQLWLTLTQARLFREGYDAATLPVSGGMDAAASVQGACRGSGTTVTVPPPALAGQHAPPGTPAERQRQGKASSCQTALEALQRGDGLRGAEGDAQPDALGFISNGTSEPGKGESAQRRGLPGLQVTSERRQNDVISPRGASDGKDPAYGALAARAGRASRRRGRRTGADRERVHGAGGAQLGGLSGQAACPVRRARPCPPVVQGDGPSGGKRGQGRPQRALPVRQRPKVQAVPRETGGGLRCDTRPSLTADRVPRLLNTTGGDAPEGMMP